MSTITIDDLQPVKSIAIARLYFNKNLPQYEDAIRRSAGMAKELGIVERIIMPTSSGLSVDMARNRIVLQCLQAGDVDAIIWIDTDMIVPDDAVSRLVQMSNAGHLIAAGVYRRARPPYQLLVEDESDTIELDVLESKLNGADVVPVTVCAGGYSIVRMELYRAMAAPWYCNWDFVSGQGETGEDRFFLLRAAELGVRPVVDPFLGAVHWSSFGPISTRQGQPEMKYAL